MSWMTENLRDNLKDTNKNSFRDITIKQLTIKKWFINHETLLKKNNNNKLEGTVVPFA